MQHKENPYHPFSVELSKVADSSKTKNGCFVALFVKIHLKKSRSIICECQLWFLEILVDCGVIKILTITSELKKNVL
jgi:hypothetical protein